MKIRPMGAEFFHADRRTERRTKLIVTFRNFAKTSNNNNNNNTYYYWLSLFYVFIYREHYYYTRQIRDRGRVS